MTDKRHELESATLGGGCFWCVEAVYLELAGVEQVRPGYAGGTTANPTYEEVCTGRTGHAEVVQVSFDPASTTYRHILEVFFAIHGGGRINTWGKDSIGFTASFNDGGGRTHTPFTAPSAYIKIPVATLVPEIETIESLATGGRLSAIQRAFHEKLGAQCGFCTPGMIMAAEALLRANPKPSTEDIRGGLAANICRCTGYIKIIDAVHAAAEEIGRANSGAEKAA